MTTVVDVCIASYRRPEGLRKLLQSLMEQETDGAFAIAVHVADNDVNRTAESVAREFAGARWPVTYDVEPVQNIALARNRSFAMARGDFIATIDDDMYADPHWIARLLESVAALNADVVHGRSERRFPAGTAPWIAEQHERPNPPTGSRSGYVRGTGNMLLRRSLIEGMVEVFDPRYGLTGGEDTDLFNRLEAKGARMIYSREPLAFEDVVAERATLRWCMQRRFRVGNNLCDVQGQRLSARELWVALRIVVILLLSTAYNVILGIASRALRAKAQSRLVATLMHASWLAGRIARAVNYRYREYQDS